MPPRALWSKRHPVALELHYFTDPTMERNGSSLSAIIKDQDHVPMSVGGVLLPDAYLEEATVDTMREAWWSYLYSEPERLQEHLSTTIKRWRR